MRKWCSITQENKPNSLQYIDRSLSGYDVIFKISPSTLAKIFVLSLGLLIKKQLLAKESIFIPRIPSSLDISHLAFITCVCKQIKDSRTHSSQMNQIADGYMSVMFLPALARNPGWGDRAVTLSELQILSNDVLIG